jgi:hypothetical protein
MHFSVLTLPPTAARTTELNAEKPRDVTPSTSHGSAHSTAAAATAGAIDTVTGRNTRGHVDNHSSTTSSSSHATAQDSEPSSPAAASCSSHGALQLNTRNTGAEACQANHTEDEASAPVVRGKELTKTVAA